MLGADTFAIVSFVLVLLEGWCFQKYGADAIGAGVIEDWCFRSVLLFHINLEVVLVKPGAR